MKNTNIIKIAFTVIVGLFLSACGGGGGNSTSPVSEIKVPMCGGVPADVTGKTIKKVLDGAEVRILHSPDGTKLACMISCEALIIN